MLLFLLSLFSIAAAVLKIEIDSNTAHEAKSLLSYVLPSLPLLMVINAPNSANVTATNDSFSVYFSLSTSWRANAGTSAAEDCERKLTPLETSPLSQLRHVNITCGGLLGLAYSLADLHEALALDDGNDAGNSVIISKYVAGGKRGGGGGGGGGVLIIISV